MSAAIPKASSRLACTCLERALISSTPKLAALLIRYLSSFSPAGVSTIRRTASALLERCRPWIKVPRLTSLETPWQRHTYWSEPHRQPLHCCRRQQSHKPRVRQNWWRATIIITIVILTSHCGIWAWFPSKPDADNRIVIVSFVVHVSRAHLRIAVFHWKEIFLWPRVRLAVFVVQRVRDD